MLRPQSGYTPEDLLSGTLAVLTGATQGFTLSLMGAHAAVRLGSSKRGERSGLFVRPRGSFQFRPSNTSCGKIVSHAKMGLNTLEMHTCF